MTLVLELPQTLEAELAEEAAQLGEAVADYAVRVLTKRSTTEPQGATDKLLREYWFDAGLLVQSDGQRHQVVSAQFHLPDAVQDRLQHLLDRQDAGTLLTSDERREAEGLVELAEFLSLLHLRTMRTTQYN